MANVQDMKTPVFFPSRSWLLAAALVVMACSDLASVPDRVPESLIIEPTDTMITQGDRAPLRVTVLDQDGVPFPSIPSWAPPEWSFSDPTAVGVAPDGTLEGLGGGEVWVQAKLAGLSATSKLRVNPNMVALSAPIVYLVQSIQNPQGDVPLIAGVKALLRVFVSSDPASFYQPRARATFYLGGAEVHSVTLVPRSYLIPQEVIEGRLDRSFNAVIPGSVLQPGIEMVVGLDVDSTTPLAPGSQVRIPAEGRRALDVRALPPFDVTIVPVIHPSSSSAGLFGWIENLTPTGSTLRFFRSMLPVGELDLEIHEPYTTAVDLTTDGGWREFLREVTALRIAEGSHRNYYGAVVLPPGSKWGGLASIGNPVSVGRPTASTFAHELGHNLSLRHAPCGEAGGPDPAFPHDGGSIGVWGYETNLGSGLGLLRDPDQFKDLMGYCSPRWISDYHFKKAMGFRLGLDPSQEPPGQPQQVLLLWGSAGDGEILLEPSFVLNAPPTLPTEDGPYRLEGRDREGGVLFSLSFAPEGVEWGGGQFAFAVPLGTEDIEALEAISLTGPEGAVTVDRSTRLPRMALAIDGATGRIRAILRNGVVPAAVRENATVTVSEGLPDSGQMERRE
ncbi:MAG: hypothetical protein HKO65_11705 [Gemmatimonadetes bacterium]|nr:hypothetical protein [Gemmatimonadota bacterium]